MPETRYHCYVRPIPLRLALMTLTGKDRGPVVAGLFGMVSKTVDRALDGGVVSETLMANALAAFELNADRLARVGLTVSFDQFFRWGTSADESEAAPAEAAA